MKKTIIRRGVYETNSSSSHSISLAESDKEFVLDMIYPDQFGRVFVNGGEFGWEFDKFNDAKTKLNYAFQDYVDRELLEQVIKEQTGATVVTFNDIDGGYIDHQSVGTARDICVDFESTRNFIFNKNSWLFTGNDNSTSDPTFYDVPVISGGKMILPEYKYELVIDGLEKTTKFKKKPTDEELENGIESLLSSALLNSDGVFLTESSLYFQLNRIRNCYNFTYRLKQDYSKNKILFLREDSRDYYEISKRLESDEEFKNFTWKEKNELITSELKKIPGIIKEVGFRLKKLDSRNNR